VGNFLSYFSAMYRGVFILSQNVKNKEEAYGFFIRQINGWRHAYKVQQKDYHFSHVPWSCDITVTPSSQYQRDAEEMPVVLLMRPTVLMFQLTEELN